jgi:putative transposase
MGSITAEQVICTSATMLSLEDVLPQGAQKMLAAALEAEVDSFLERYKSLKTESGHQGVVRNGHAPERHVQTGLGPIKLQRPKVRAKVRDIDGQPVSFTSQILPAWLRRSKSIDELIPWLYLRGISTGDFSQSLQAILGPDAQGLSATNVCRPKESWMNDFKDWSKRDLSVAVPEAGFDP